MKYLIILLFILLPIKSVAQHNIHLNVGISKGIVYREQFNKFASLGYSYDFTRVSLKGEVGGWLDFQPGHSHSAFASTSFGFKAVSDLGLFAEIFFGPAVITHPDAVLGSHPQLQFQLGGGIQTKYVELLLIYKHFSNAGIFSGPNLGRDWGCVGVRWRL